jgi:ubiquitin-conjugating enzyme (huntingtin interacting protein 2)
MAAEIRLTKELKDVTQEDESSGVRAVQVRPNDNKHLKGTLKGPEGTCYEGGVFEVDIVIPNAYPFEPPRMVSLIVQS